VIGATARTDTITVEKLLDGIETGSVALADFQRDFDWSGAAIRSLVATVLMGWPAGSLLAVVGDHPDLEVRRFEGGPEPYAPLWMIILDGQQRLTALFSAASDGFRGLQISVEALETGDLDVIEERLETRSPAGPPSLHPAIEALRIPLSAARSRSEFFSWRAAVTRDLPVHVRDEAELRLSQVYRDHLHWMHDHQFPTIVLPSTISESAVARIFERVNRTGMKLGSFDLVVARAYSRTWNLRERWEEARYRYPLLETFFEDDGLPALQTIALKHRRDVRQAAVLALDARLVLNTWEPAVEALDSALRFLVQECGVLRPDWLPYRAFPILLAGIALDTRLDTLVQELRAYVFTRAFALRFDAAANTRVVEDYSAICDTTFDRVFLAKRPPFASSRMLIGSTRQRQGAIFRAFLCLLASRRAEDPHGRRLSLHVDDAGDGDHDDGLPVNVSLLKRDNDERLHLRTLGMVLAAPTTALEIARETRQAPTALPPRLFGDEAPWMATQMVPNVLNGAASEPSAFLRTRLELLAKCLEGEFQQSVAGDLD